MYSLLLETYIRDPLEKDHLYQSVKTIKSIKRKADWAFRWISG